MVCLLAFNLGNRLKEDNGYLLLGFEIGLNNGTPNTQGYVRFKSPRCFKIVKSLIGIRSHLEQAEGTENQNKVYCTKSGIYEEYGTSKSQGQRSDLEKAAYALNQENKSLKDIASDLPCVYIRYHRGLKELKNKHVPVKPRDFRSDVYISYRPTRTGKSRAARQMAGDLSVYYKNRSPWWRNYQQGDVVILDDFYSWIP